MCHPHATSGHADVDKERKDLKYPLANPVTTPKGALEATHSRMRPSRSTCSGTHRNTLSMHDM